MKRFVEGLDRGQAALRHRPPGWQPGEPAQPIAEGTQQNAEQNPAEYNEQNVCDQP